MKLSDFISKYTSCPICDRKIDITFNLNLRGGFNYNLNQISSDGFEFIKMKEISVNNISKVGISPLKIKYSFYQDSSSGLQYLPHIFTMKDFISFPEELLLFNNGSNSLYGSGSFRIECVYNDFLCSSTNFNIFDQEQLVEIASEGFEINSNAIVYNDYETKITTIRVRNTTQNDRFNKIKELNLIPIDKWPTGDKIKMKEKIDKLLVLI